MQASTSGAESTTYPASNLVFSTAAGANDSTIDLKEAVLEPTENYTVIYNLPAAGTADVIIGFNWQEDF
tara:strand:- start:7355 stop:7561 length:207 start_codon:yes stop_codon:yes gene_type:complete